MNNQKEQVSSASLMFTIGCFIQSSTLVVGYITGVAKQDTWLTVIFGFIVALPIIWIFAALGEKFPGKNLIEINDAVFGKIPGKIISVLYIFFFFSLTFLNSGVMTDFVSSSLLPDTPDIAVLIMFIGAFPGRNPLNLALLCTSLYSFSSAALTASTETSISNLRDKPSSFCS